MWQMEVMAGRWRSSLGTSGKAFPAMESTSTSSHLMSKAVFYVPPLPLEGEPGLCYLLTPLCSRWCRKSQVIDLRAEGYWEELMDTTQPKIVVKDW